MIGFPVCDNSTCHSISCSNHVENACSSPYLICTSQCEKDSTYEVFQCDDQGLVLLSQFCDGIVDCKDGSDEFSNEPGFKCSKCILPQSNLYDDLVQCDDNADLCFLDNTSCFQCFDQSLLISSKQVCDGVRDCYDMSDECLCEKYFDSEMCKSAFEENKFRCFDNENVQNWINYFVKENVFSASKSSFVTCNSKFNSSIRAVTCDDRPECKDYSDECKCAIPPAFCHDTCHSIFPMGDRYCDGVEDPAWQFINDLDCPKGFDELNCPNRFRCKTKGKLSIDVLLLCDGKMDCEDDSDEKDCHGNSNRQAIFSSDTEMIANPAISVAFWIIGIAVLSGNSYVFISTIALLREKKSTGGVAFQHLIILNLSVADFLMGVYLITIAAFSATFSGVYGEIDHEWRSSLKCSIIGSLAIISSQSSCFFIVVLTAFRLKNIADAFGSLTSSLRVWKISIGLAWLLSLIISITPLLNITSPYFVHTFSHTSRFHNGTWDASELTKFACRLAALKNTTIRYKGNKFQSAAIFIQNSFSTDSVISMFGYYGETSVCMPRFYTALEKNSWEYTIFIITVNFLSFVFIVVGYSLIIKLSLNSSANIQSSRNNKQFSKMQKRIACIIATDFCCWIPICVMAYGSLGVEFSDIVYQISAVMLLPINSALNPLLFTPLPDKLIKFFRRQRPV